MCALLLFSSATTRLLQGSGQGLGWPLQRLGFVLRDTCLFLDHYPVGRSKHVRYKIYSRRHQGSDFYLLGFDRINDAMSLKMSEN